MKETTLLILAAGMGSRYGGLKQMDEFGPSGETIIDYSIYDAIATGFDEIVFVIRESFKADFETRFEAKLKGKVKTAYVCQELFDIPAGVLINPEREKPWGTGHAILAARNIIRNPFAVINADDFYGREAFRQMHDFLTEKVDEKHCAIMGYRLEKTLSDNGTVSRGVCKVNAKNILTEIKEHTKIERNKKGEIIFENEQGEQHPLQGDSLVSMNFWGFHEHLFDHLRNLFTVFLQESGQELKSEFYIPFAVDTLRERGDMEVAVIPTNSEWFGVTYKEDRDTAVAVLQKMLDAGAYPKNLWV